MRIVGRTLLVLALVGAVTGALVVGFGLYNVSARVGHLPGVNWLLHTTFRQSVRLRAPSEDAVPVDLADPDRVKLGALHFQTACAFCHSVPGQPLSATAMSMNPVPPHITDAVEHWEPRHMFWIVREGVKMSGMPHWPATGRGDEVWSVVAYLKAVGEDGEVSAGNDGCTGCHGIKGRSVNAYIPRLDILTVDQIGDALKQYRDGSRASGFMREAALKLTDVQIGELARELGGSIPPVGTPPNDRTDPGWVLASRGTVDVPACAACHGPGRSGEAPVAPALAGQSQAYLEAQLRLWRDGARGGGKRAGLMRKAAQDLSDDDIRVLAAWYASLRH